MDSFSREKAVKKNPIPVPNGGRYIVISLGKAACLLMKTMRNQNFWFPEIDLYINRFDEFAVNCVIRIFAVTHTRSYTHTHIHTHINP